jgi:hypothetical protein
LSFCGFFGTIGFIKSNKTHEQYGISGSLEEIHKALSASKAEQFE